LYSELMTQVRLSVEKFAGDIDAALAGLAGGDEVLLERFGQVVARVKPEPSGTDWKLFVAKLRLCPPLGSQFREDVESAIAERNGPPGGHRPELSAQPLNSA
jgi:hypothetical protein